MGIGNPLLDVIVEVDDDFFESLGYRKGSMNLITGEQSRNITDRLRKMESRFASGGSSANTIYGTRLLGNNVSFFGVVGKDNFGERYNDDFLKEGIDSQLSFHDDDMTGHSIIMVTPDKDRTMFTHLGAALNFSVSHVREDMIRNAKALHIEAYHLEDENLREANLHAMEIAKEASVPISLDLSDTGLIKRNKELFAEIVREYVDIVFANEEEAMEFSDANDPEEALCELSDLCDVAVVKLGANGSMIKNGKDIFRFDTHKVDVVNTNGAGDMYAAGILHGLVNGLGLQRAGEIASHVSALVVASAGARMDEKYHDLISKYKI